MTRDEIANWAEFLEGAPDPESLTEDALLEHLATGSDRQRWAAAILLGHFGTDRAAGALRAATRARRADLQIASAFSLLKIEGAAAADFFAESLADRAFREKWAASICLSRSGGPEHADAVLGRIRAISGRKRSTVVIRLDGTETSEPLEALAFLRRNRLPVAELARRVAQRPDWFTETERAAIATAQAR